LRIGTPSGVVKAAAEVRGSGVDWQVPRTSTFRTARRLMTGWVHG
jgi:2-methylaconitate cis-trans-isomerase PrpF